MLRIIAVIVLCCLTACGTTVLRDNAGKRGEGYASPTPIDPPEPQPETPAEVVTPWAPLPDSAIIPVPISGASLFCYREGSINCLASDSSGAPFRFSPAKVYYSDSKTQKWVATTFVATSKASTWTVAIPNGMVDAELGILLLSEDNYYLANWISPTPADSSNLVKDGSFENLVIDPGNLEMTRFLLPSLQLTWKARIPDYVSGSCYPIIELSASDYSAIPAAQNGKQWVQLTAPCEPGLGSNRNLIAISQELKLKVAHHYELSFYYRASRSAAFPNEILFNVTKGQYTRFSVTQNDWTLYKTVFTATEVSQTLEFMEKGLVANGGTAIDSISVIEIGSPDSRILLGKSADPTVVPVNGAAKIQ